MHRMYLEESSQSSAAFVPEMCRASGSAAQALSILCFQFTENPHSDPPCMLAVKHRASDASLIQNNLLLKLQLGAMQSAKDAVPNLCAGPKPMSARLHLEVP